LSISDLLAFARATATSGDSRLIQSHLWQLGLMQDETLLQQSARQLVRQRALLQEIASLSKTVRTRMVRVVAGAQEIERLRLQPAYHRLLAYFNTGKREALRDLTMAEAQRLVQAGKSGTAPARGRANGGEGAGT